MSREFRNFNGDAFSYGLSLAPWHIIQYKSNQNSAWEIWKSTFQKISDAHAAVHKRKIRINHSLWLTLEPKKLMFKMNNLKKTPTNNKTSDNQLKYRLTRNKVNDSIKCAKVAYYNNYFKETLGHTRDSWKRVIVIMWKNPHQTDIHNISIGDVTYTSSSEMGSRVP